MLDCFIKEKRSVKIGVAPIRRTTWSHKPFNLQEAIRTKDAILSALNKFDAEFVTLEGLTEDGLLFTVEDAERVAKHFIGQEVDAVFIPHCNFGSEESAACLCKRVGKPVLLWGPKDYINPDDLYRYRDSQCGMFATSKVLSMYGVPFTYIENCDLEDVAFADGLNRFIAVVSVVKAFGHMRIGQIGTRPGPFASMKFNEIELLEKFGIEVIPINMTDLQNMLRSYEKQNPAQIEDGLREMREKLDVGCVTEDELRKIIILKKTVEKWALDERLSAAVCMCWGPMIQTAGIAPCFVLGDVCDDGFPFICESDVHGAITAVMAMAASRYSTPIFLADITIRHPENPNAELLWHCGVFAKGLAKEGENLKLNRHYNRLCPAVGEWELKGGEMNVLRFDGMRGNYSMLLGAARGTTGPKTVGAYVWIEVDDWSKWERKLIYGPYVHHCVGIHQDVRDVLEEACRYIPGLAPDRV